MLDQDYKDWSKTLSLKDEEFCELMKIPLKTFLDNKPQ